MMKKETFRSIISNSFELTGLIGVVVYGWNPIIGTMVAWFNYVVATITILAMVALAISMGIYENQLKVNNPLKGELKKSISKVIQEKTFFDRIPMFMNFAVIGLIGYSGHIAGFVYLITITILIYVINEHVKETVKKLGTK